MCWSEPVVQPRSLPSFRALRLDRSAASSRISPASAASLWPHVAALAASLLRQKTMLDAEGRPATLARRDPTTDT